MIKYIDELKKEDLAEKKVLLRADLDIPIVEGKMGESFRVKAQKETLDYLASAGAKVLLVAHLGHETSDISFAPIVEEIGEILGHTLTLVPHLELNSVDLLFKGCSVLLLDNIRQDKREIENDGELAKELAEGMDYYVDNAFATMHREHASIVAVAKFLPSYAGLLIKRELENLTQVINASSEGKILVLGGAKISTKLPVIKNFLISKRDPAHPYGGGKAEKILIGGALANDFFKERGIGMGSSLIDDGTPVNIKSEKIVLPRDFITGTRDGNPDAIKLYKKVESIDPEEAILDIGPETAEEWAEIIRKSKMVIWNGPMGYFEAKDFEEGTEVIAEAVAKVERSIIGGGDTIAAASKFNLLDRYGFVSTGGGAMLEFLAGNKLPGLEALGYYD